ncbi:preprotein translocase subunit SecE [Williamsia sp. CHRR-6]|uniref:preprotein translocase subunit SecE n=1 Tax=Williamsia sp. CHRR-6 TaxID=2835871 RepID=UPI001BD94C52|nr:preprotein translocase subunit SecE [Williamsia sp. CHRR-6]MBT0565897.1 preprotein translocase subunit SecE [Williamsia sp. CHRR-6]
MEKRDRAARAKGAAGVDATDAGVDDDRDADALTDDVDESTPSGKRAAPRGKRAAARAGSGVALKERTAESTADQKDASRNPFARLWLFLGQVVSELKKVIWPTRQEMIRYTIIVLIFVIVMTAFISGIDLGFAKVVLWMFG